MTQCQAMLQAEARGVGQYRSRLVRLGVGLADNGEEWGEAGQAEGQWGQSTGCDQPSRAFTAAKLMLLELRLEAAEGREGVRARAAGPL